ncbi:uncharacterized protein LOC134853303 isoform X2 [Symsagittifera roscoffensis]
MHDIPGLRESPGDALLQAKKDSDPRLVKSSNHFKSRPPINPKYSKHRSRDFDCCGWTDEFEFLPPSPSWDDSSCAEISLTSWLESRKGGDLTDSNWRSKQQWEKYSSADVKQRCKGAKVEKDEEWKGLRLDLGARSMTDTSLLPTTTRGSKTTRKQRADNRRAYEANQINNRQSSVDCALDADQFTNDSSLNSIEKTFSNELSASMNPATMSGFSSCKSTAADNPSQLYRCKKQSEFYLQDTLQRSKSNLILKTFQSSDKSAADSYPERTKQQTARHKSGHAATVPTIVSPIKYLENSTQYRLPSSEPGYLWMHSRNLPSERIPWKKREFYDDGESREPSPFGFRRQKTNPDMQNYRSRKLVKVAVKLKDATFAAPAPINNTFANSEQMSKNRSPDEYRDQENHIYVQKYTDVSSRNHVSSEPVNFLPTGQPIQFTGKPNSKNENPNFATEVYSGCIREHKPPIKMRMNHQQQTSSKRANQKLASSLSAPSRQNLNSQSALSSTGTKTSINFISADIASEKAAIDSLNLLQSLEKKRRGRPIKTRLLGSEKLACSSPDFQSRPFGVDREGFLLGAHSAKDDCLSKINNSATSSNHFTATLPTSLTSNASNKTFSLSQPQLNWKL